MTAKAWWDTLDIAAELSLSGVRLDRVLRLDVAVRAGVEHDHHLADVLRHHRVVRREDLREHPPAAPQRPPVRAHHQGHLKLLRGEGWAVDVVFNLRRRPDGDGDQWVRDAVRDAGLLELTNDFEIQRYGLASGDQSLDLPYLAGEGFTLVNPDGSTHGTDLIARSEAMGALA